MQGPKNFIGGALVAGSERQQRIVHSHVTDAVARGATVLIGGTIPYRTGFCYPAPPCSPRPKTTC